MKNVHKRLSINVGGFDSGDKKKVPLNVPTPQIPSFIKFEKEQNKKSDLGADLLDKLDADLGGDVDQLPQRAAVFMDQV